MSFDELRTRWTWKPIPHCPGRYVLQGGATDLTPAQLLNCDAAVQEFQTPHARDTVVVAVCEGGGLISYRRPDGTYCHTLNTAEGLARKLHQLGLPRQPA
jgi:hypothetical protein